jgi:phosphatidylserine decarboxylase
MATPWHGVVNPPRSASVRTWDYAPGEVVLRRGEEMGRFLLGSTVVLLWPSATLDFVAGWAPGGAVRLGEAMAEAPPAAAAH